MGGVFMKKGWKALCVCLLAAALVWTGTLISDRQRLDRELIRLHVVANSDSREDQDLKLRVRDAVTASIREALVDMGDMEQAKAYLEESLPKLQAMANEVLEAAGSAQRAVVKFCQEKFPVRDYDTFSLPGGVYQSLRIVIGDGEGENWWCVVFPELCTPRTEADFRDVAVGAGFPEDLTDALTGEERGKVRFFLLDKLGQLEAWLRNLGNA